MNRKQKTLIRFVVIFLIITIGFVAVLAQIILIQTTERQKWLDVAKYQTPVEVEIVPQRGIIYDAKGRMLAGSMPKYTIAMDMRTKALHLGGDTLFYNNVDSIAAGLAAIFKDKSASEYKAKLVRDFRERRPYARLYPRMIDYAQLKRVKSLPLLRKGIMTSGLHVEEKAQRVKPFGSLAGRTIGNVNAESGQGHTGLESSFNQYLSGTPGLSRKQRVQGRNQEVEVKPAIKGKDIVTTIDANLQDIAESTLRQRLEYLDGQWGCCILMEVKTGEIKAIVNLDKTSSGTYMELQQHTLQNIEPGSTFKTISLMAALESGVVDYQQDSFRVYKDGWKYVDTKIYDAHPKDTTYCVRDAMAVSSNIALAKMITGGYKGDAKRFVEKLTDMGIADSVPSDVAGSQNPIVRIPRDQTTLAKMSYGYSVELSPLKIVSVYNAIANDGKMIAPILVKEVAEDGACKKRMETHVLKNHICSDKTLRAIRECLHAVVWDNHLGTASMNPWKRRKAQSELVSIAGKTGTAQIFENGRYNNHHHRITFVGYFPEKEPQYTCICVIHHPQKYGYYDAGMDCGSVVREIAEKTMAYAAERDLNENKPSEQMAKPNVKGGKTKQVLTALRKIGLHANKCDSHWAKIDNDMHMTQLEVDDSVVPDVTGMAARDAVYAIEQTGMRAQISGRGKVVKQSVAPGSNTIRGGTVHLELRAK